MEDKFEKLYYSPDGYWRGETAVNKLADAAGSSTTEARQWLQQQPIYQIYLPPPSKITRPKFVEDKPNAVHRQIFCFYHMTSTSVKCISTLFRLLIWQHVLRLADR